LNSLNHNSAEPLYHQIFLILRTKIAQGEWKAGDLLPAEPELMAQFQVSRTTIRLALDRLVNVGLVYRQRGRGTFVAPPKLEQQLNRGLRFTESLVQEGFQAESQLLASHLTPASEQNAHDLNVALHEPLAVIERLRLVNGEPIGVQLSALVYRYCPEILRYDFAKDSLYGVLEKSYGLRAARVKQVVQAVAASATLAKQLKTPTNFPLLYLERIAYLADGRPFEIFRGYYRSDRYALHSELQPPDP
jgi:GntR family transcriptional regulator